MWRSSRGLSEAWTAPITGDTTSDVSETPKRVSFANTVEVRQIVVPTKRLVAGPWTIGLHRYMEHS